VGEDVEELVILCEGVGVQDGGEESPAEEQSAHGGHTTGFSAPAGQKKLAGQGMHADEEL